MYPILTSRYFKWITVIIILVFSYADLSAQQLKITDFVLFAGNPSCPGCLVQLSSSTNIQGGSVGSYTLVKTTGTSTISSNIYSGGIVQLAGSNSVTGNITAANSPVKTGTILSVGSGALLKGNIDVNGNIVVSGGTVTGKVTHPQNTTYTGPTPSGGNVTANPTIPDLPAMPAIANFPSTRDTNITSTGSINPGAYGNIILGGNKILTLSGPGIYVFKSIKNSGNANDFVFDFKGATAGSFKIYIQGDAEMGKVTASLKNGGAASRIFTEIHGSGSTFADGVTALNISNGSSGKSSKWLGTVWVPNGSINIGSGTGNSDLTGALISGTKINIQSGVTIKYESFAETDVIFPYYPPPTNGKVTDLLGSELFSLYNNSTGINDVAQNIFIINNGTVMIEVIAKEGKVAQLLALLQTAEYGLTNIISNDPTSLIITGRFPIANLIKLDALTDLINYCRPLYPAVSNSGITTSNGDIAIRSDFVRNGYNLSGQGIKVGVLSDSYNTIPGDPAQIDVANSDLPGAGNIANATPVEVVKDYPFGRRSDEGRAMLQIIHDIAPKANLGFRTGFISAGDFALGIKEMQQKNYNVLVDDITYITEPYFQDGVVAKAIDEVTAQGVSYFASAGNYANKSYQSIFNAATAPAGLTGNAHNFGGGDIFQSVSLKPGTYTIVLQWADNVYSLGQTQTGTQNDLDIYLTDNNGATLFGFNRNNLGGDPIEVLPFTVSANAQTNIMVVRAAGSEAVNFKLIVFRGDLTFNEHAIGQSTIVGGANSLGAITVGAVRYTNTPAFGVTTPVLETFSSIGGTPVNGVARNKPDVTAPDGVNTSVDFASLNIEGDQFPNFFGTSAAVPHAAGVAALLLEGKLKFSSQATSPAQMKSLLQSTALDMSTPGNDLNSGAGFVRAQSAMATFANPSPSITNLVLPNSSFVPGSAPFTVTVQGDYLSDQTKILFRGSEVNTTFISPTQLTASIPAFTGNPAIQALTQPKSINQNDGGTSSPIFFFNTIKKKVVITAKDESKKFGEKLPAFSAIITVDNVPLATSGLTPADIGLDQLSFTSSATDLSNVGKYFIRPVRAFDAHNTADAILLEAYEYTFKDGVLSVDKMPLVITPEDKTITYGDNIKNITFNYQYDEANIAVANRSIVLNNLKLEHAINLIDTVIGFINGKGIVAGRTLTATDLENISFLASSKSIVASKPIVAGKAVVAGALVPDTMRIIEISLASVFNYQVNPEEGTLVNTKAIVAAKAMVAFKAIVAGKPIVAGTQIVNSETINETSNSNLVVIVDAADVSAPADEPISELKAINLITGLTAGESFIVPAPLLSENFEIQYGLGKLTILPAALTVKANDTGIVQGSPLPVTFTSTVSGFVNNENTIVSGPAYTITPTYSGAAGLYSIMPSALTLSTPENYTISYSNGTLYVNPKGGSTKNVMPKLDCVELLATPVSGFSYVAHFSYQNPNALTIYVPVGTDNRITSLGSYSGKPPVIFLPTGGKFDIYFDGKKLTWTIITYNGNKKTAVASDASSTSSRCPSILSAVGNNSADFSPSTGLSRADAAQPKITAWPNPVKNKVRISISNTAATSGNIFIFDMLGRIHKPASVQRKSTNIFELDVSNLNKGQYLIKVKGSNILTTGSITKL